jgi:hypothetical protein
MNRSSGEESFGLELESRYSRRVNIAQREHMTIKIWKLSLYLVITCLFMVFSLEALLRFAFSDPDFYWDRRFLFVSPNAYQNRGDRFWTYVPHTTIREAAVYAMPSLFTAQPKIFVEYDCSMKSNNLGLLQDDDIEAGAVTTLIVGDSFTAGQGGCPWFGRLQARRKSDRLVNAGVMGTGCRNWMRLTQYLLEQGILARRLVLVAISGAFGRTGWVWSQGQLDCLQHGACPLEDNPLLWLPLELHESQSNLIQRSAVRFSIRFGRPSWRDSSEAYLQNLFLPKFTARAYANLGTVSERSGPTLNGTTFPEAEEALEWFKSLGIPIHVLLVTQRDEIKPFENRRALATSAAVLNAHGIAHSRCDLSQGDFMRYDGHPNQVGYDKLVLCVDRVLQGEEQSP